MAEGLRKYNRAAPGCQMSDARCRRPVPGCLISDIRHPRSSRGQHHDDLAGLEPRLLLDLGEFGGIVLDAVEELGAQILVRHLASAEAQRHLDLVAFLE